VIYSVKRDLLHSQKRPAIISRLQRSPRVKISDFLSTEVLIASIGVREDIATPILIHAGKSRIAVA
jgi:hypothetical protein